MADSALKGQSAIVTGAGRGIGRAIACRLAAAGAHVTLAARTADQLAETQRLIESQGGRGLACPTDVTNERDVEKLVSTAVSAAGSVHILVNNAGTAPLARIEDMPPPMFDSVLATNIRAVYLCCRAVWKPMAAHRRGTIINISSVAAHDPFPGFAAYGAAKAFVNAYTKALATEGANLGVRVLAVAPGAVDTSMLRGAFPDYPADKMLKPDDIAALVETLLSPACQYVTGQTIQIQKQ